jgi:hypothetical protein
VQAKLLLKEQETVHLQRQIQDLQAQLVSVQLNGLPSGLSQQLERMNTRCQELQAENQDIRALALHYLEENALLRAVRYSPRLTSTTRLVARRLSSGLQQTLATVEYLCGAGISRRRRIFRELCAP